MSQPITNQQALRIAEIQNAFIAAGYQWKERVFNDGNPRDSSLMFTRSQNPHYFDHYILGDFGWGRYSRVSAWNMAYDWLFKRLTGEQPHPEPKPVPRPEE